MVESSVLNSHRKYDNETIITGLKIAVGNSVTHLAAKYGATPYMLLLTSLMNIGLSIGKTVAALLTPPKAAYSTIKNRAPLRF